MRGLGKIVGIIRQYGAEKIILFGSRAYGKSGRDSDFDLAIIKKTSLSYHRRLKNLRMQLRNTVPLDLFIFTPKEFEEAKSSNALVAEIARKGKVIYEK